jgi:nucleoside phosphorylase
MNLGAAGATDQDHPLGEIYHITEVIEYDRPILKSGSTRIHRPHRLKGFQTGKIITQDRPVHYPHERKELSPLAGLVDMEGASVIQACKIFKTRCYLFKFVSDTPEHTGHEDIKKNILLYSRPFYEFFADRVLPRLINR